MSLDLSKEMDSSRTVSWVYKLHMIRYYEKEKLIKEPALFQAELRTESRGFPGYSCSSPASSLKSDDQRSGVQGPDLPAKTL
jgi:hypothetical protein